ALPDVRLRPGAVRQYLLELPARFPDAGHATAFRQELGAAARSRRADGVFLPARLRDPAQRLDAAGAAVSDDRAGCDPAVSVRAPSAAARVRGRLCGRLPD